MPRGPRLDAPGVVQHVMLRGIERRPLFADDRDRRDCVGRLAAGAAGKAWRGYAWALLPHHVHRLVRTGRRPLARTMGVLLAGYAGAFNRRHRRHDHLFQNRYKSIVVEEDPYLLELTRHIHLNPLRAGLVRDLTALDRYPWTGHSVLMGKRAGPGQEITPVLGHFGRTVGQARRRSRAFVAAGIPHGRRPELQGGGLRRSVRGWEGIAALRRGRERWAFDERVLGSGSFVERLLAEVPPPGPARPARAWRSLPVLVAHLAPLFGVTELELASGRRRRPVAAARAAVGAVAVMGLGLPAAPAWRAVASRWPEWRTR